MPITMEQVMGRDQVLAIDASGSMQLPANNGTGQSRWEATHEASLAYLGQLLKVDPDGVDVIVFNSQVHHIENCTIEKLNEVFESEQFPSGSTNMTAAINTARQIYEGLKGKEGFNGFNLSVIGDGEPNSKKGVAAAIADWANTLTPDMGVSEGKDTLDVGIQLLQMGNDSRATAFLTALDDDLTDAGAKFDIVDTKTYDEMEAQGLTVKDLLLASVND